MDIRYFDYLGRQHDHPVGRGVEARETVLGLRYIRILPTKDSEGFPRYNGEIWDGGNNWVMVSPEALDYDTIYREIDSYLNN